MKTLVVAAVALCAAAGAAMAEDTVAFGSLRTMSLTGAAPFGPRAATVVYDNTTGAATFATSSTDLGATWGDTLDMTGGGTLDSFKLAIYNSSSSAGAFKSGTVNVNFFDAGSSAFLGGFSATLDYGTDNLPKGFYDIWTITDLSGLGINLGTKIVATQNFSKTSVTGGTSRMGVISAGPVSVGSSTSNMYLSNASTPAGFYTSTAGPANLAYQVQVIPAPGALAVLGLAGAVASRRRR